MNNFASFGHPSTPASGNAIHGRSVWEEPVSTMCQGDLIGIYEAQLTKLPSSDSIARRDGVGGVLRK